MKKILLVMTSMNIGGIATSINNMIELADKELYQFDLLLFDNSCGYDGCESIIDAGKYMRLIAINQRKAFSENKVLGLYRLILGGWSKLFGHGIPYRLLLSKTSPVEKVYDVAISCSQSGPENRLYGGCNEYVLAKVKASLKIAYIHCDYKTYGLDSTYSHSIYSKFDRIACVSESVRKCFLQCEPSFSDKTYIATNFQNYEKINRMADEHPYEYDRSVFNIITVARIGKEKGHLRMLPIIKHLIEMGKPFMWHIIGGDENEAPEEFISQMTELNVRDCIVFHGNQKNPYRYMKNADLLLIPSYHEAAPMVYAEASCLGLPILTTNTLSAKELVEKTGIGIVCENDDVSIEKALMEIIKDPNSIRKYSLHNTIDITNACAQNEFDVLTSR